MSEKSVITVCFSTLTINAQTFSCAAGSTSLPLRNLAQSIFFTFTLRKRKKKKKRNQIHYTEKVFRGLSILVFTSRPPISSKSTKHTSQPNILRF